MRLWGIGTRTDATESENQEGVDGRFAMTTVHGESQGETGDPRVDATTEKLTVILVGIMDNLETWPGLTPQAYGRQFQDYWDAEFSGDLARRRRAKFVPGEAAAKVVQTKEPAHKDEFDEWLAPG